MAGYYCTLGAGEYNPNGMYCISDIYYIVISR